MLLCGLLAVTCCAEAPVSTYQVVHTFPHDRSAFTQGLEYRNGFLYESTGLNGRSSLRKVDLQTGRVLQKVDVPYEHFGEGITMLAGEILQLTWRSQVGFVYGLTDFKMKRMFRYPGEGWGLANNGTHIYMSDGSNEIRIWNPKTLAEVKRLRVMDGGIPIDQLNELEIVDGELYANVYQTQKIVRISPATGKVLGWIDLTGILSPMYQTSDIDVLNGIAYDAAAKRLFVTGKLWPTMFEIKVVPKKAAQTKKK